MPRRRIEQLDSLRGVAALSVMIYHYVLLFPPFMALSWAGTGNWVFGVLAFTPLRAPWAGTSAVILFFLLSGYVLSLPFQAGTGPSYPAFVIKRVYRLYPPYLVAIASAWVLLQFVDLSRGRHQLSRWYLYAWQSPHLSRQELTQHASMIGSFNAQQLDSVTWSLAYEMRISLLFPLLMLLVVRSRPRVVLAVCLASVTLGQLLSGGSRQGDQTLSEMLFYLPMFVAGAMLARHHVQVGRWFRALRRGATATLGVAAVVAYSWPFVLPWVHPMHPAILDHAGPAAASALLIVLALESPRWAAALRARSTRWLGRISYSLYLVHVIVLLTALHLWYGRVPLVLLLAGSAAASFGIATLGRRFVEEPTMALGHVAAARLGSRRTGRAARPAPIHDRAIPDTAGEAAGERTAEPAAGTAPAPADELAGRLPAVAPGGAALEAS